MEEEEVIRRRLVAILDQCFSIAYPNFKTTTLFSVLHHCYLVKGRIHMYCKYMRGGFLSFHPLYHPHDFSHKIIKNGRIMWCATLPSMQWVIALYEAIYHQWVNNYFEETVGVVNEPRQLKTYSYYRSQDCDVSTVLLMVIWQRWLRWCLMKACWYTHLLSVTVRVYSLVAPCRLPDLTSLALLGSVPGQHELSRGLLTGYKTVSKWWLRLQDSSPLPLLSQRFHTILDISLSLGCYLLFSLMPDCPLAPLPQVWQQ